jgi:hypothetical protein
MNATIASNAETTSGTVTLSNHLSSMMNCDDSPGTGSDGSRIVDLVCI